MPAAGVSYPAAEGVLDSGIFFVVLFVSSSELEEWLFTSELFKTGRKQRVLLLKESLKMFDEEIDSLPRREDSENSCFERHED